MLEYIINIMRAAARTNPALPMFPAKAALLWAALIRWAGAPAHTSLCGSVSDTATSAIGGWWTEAIPLWEEALSVPPFKGWHAGSGRQYARDNGGRLLRAARDIFSAASEKTLFGTLEGNRVIPTAEEAETLTLLLQSSPLRRREMAIETIRDTASKNGVVDPRDGVSVWPSSRAIARDMCPWLPDENTLLGYDHGEFCVTKLFDGWLIEGWGRRTETKVTVFIRPDGGLSAVKSAPSDGIEEVIWGAYKAYSK